MESFPGNRRRKPQKKANRGARNTTPTNNQLVPPVFGPTLGLLQRFRFTDPSAATNVPITRAMLLNLVSMASTTTVQQRLIFAVKLVHISVWAVPSSTSTTQTSASVEWMGLNSPSTFSSATTMGNARPLHLSCKPPADTSNRLWSINQQNEAEVVFRISAPAGAIVDLQLKIRFQDNEGAQTAENGTGGASTVGVIYLNYMDGFTSKLFIPYDMANPTLP
jgi:hypothetical protein